ncbi:rod shape-determining protein MreD [Alkalibacillus aidingensis]|uniref:rod shape-determining protein MreD n=1 Tax=Alkalibacillus aidingensis TaxID=2747607 RepID=UPI0016607BE8|nr:rod shape-determining protein MreD [Alkalibacillus aidingensis]
MKVFLLPLFMFLFLVLESVAVELIPQTWWLSNLYYIPHWTLILAALMVVFYDQEHSYVGLLNGIVFAFIIDLAYTNVLGVYLLGYGIALYLIHVLKRFFHRNMLVMLLFIVIALVSADFIIYGLYLVIGQISLDLNDYLLSRLIPTVMINILFLLLIYPIFAKRFSKWKQEIENMK